VGGGGGADVEQTTRNFEVCTLHILIGILLKMGETNGHGSTVIEWEMCTAFQLRYLKGQHLEDAELGRRIILKWDVE
jgi:hypothetical protein